MVCKSNAKKNWVDLQPTEAIKLLEKSLTEIFLRKNDNRGNNSRYFKQLINLNTQ